MLTFKILLMKLLNVNRMEWKTETIQQFPSVNKIDVTLANFVLSKADY